MIQWQTTEQNQLVPISDCVAMIIRNAIIF